jgi:xyloglucan 6-xylosyltransferase
MCRLHDIELYYSMAVIDSQMTSFWVKHPMIRKLMLSHPEAEWIWWMDSDAFFTDMTFEIPFEKYENHNMILHGFEDKLFEKKSWVGINAGSFLLRNCQWSLDLLDAWTSYGHPRVAKQVGEMLSQALTDRPVFDSDDQSVLAYLLVTQTAKWVPKVFLENSYYLHGYWVILVDNYENYMANSKPGYGDHRWPFVTHFVGCKPCGNEASYGMQRCLKQMERAFNFGDNQILDHYGYQHRTLNSSKEVGKVRYDTADPLGLGLSAGTLGATRSVTVS